MNHDSTDVEDHILQVQIGVRKLKRKVQKLETENGRLYASLEKSKSGSATEDDMNLEELHLKDTVDKLKETVMRVKKDNRRLLRLIDGLKAKRLQDEVDDVHDGDVTINSEGTSNEIDPMFRMRKLLRAFADLMLVSTISDDRDDVCPVCFEKFELKKCSALGCGHLICHDCLPKISKGANETIKCPVCQKITPRSELELVHFTEEGRWDALLKIANAWMAYDRRGTQETSDEEDEENFFTDSNGTSEAAESEAGNVTVYSPVIDHEEESQLPSPPNQLLFSESPTKLKRKRMEELAEQRSQRPRRI